MTDAPPAPTIRRLRHELKRRSLTVTAVQRLTPVMIRVTLQGEAMQDFPSEGFDDHMKLMLPQGGEVVERRDYTPRRFDRAAGTLVVDVVDHPGGPASDWARAAQVGATLEIAGPRGSQVIEGDIARWLLIGDETALPAIGRFVEEARPAAQVTSIVAVPGPQDEQAMPTTADLTPRWVHRPLSMAADPAPLLDALEGVALAPQTFVFIAAEAGVARALRNRLTGAGHPAAWIKAAGYWISGRADASDKALDEG